jgi:hypothetical protein
VDLQARGGTPARASSEPARRTRPRAPSSLAARLLALRRAAGNAGLARLLQRRPKLHDVGVPTYLDPGLADQPLAYVGTGSGNQPMFLLHDRFAAFQLALLATRGTIDRPRGMSEDLLLENIVTLEWKTTYRPKLVGALYRLTEDGSLVKVEIPEGWQESARQGPRVMTIAQAVMGGPWVWEEAKGSRLPKAEGTLYVHNPHARYGADDARLRRDVLMALGVRSEDFGKYDRVAVARVADLSTVVGTRKITFGARERGDVADGLVYVSAALVPQHGTRPVLADGKPYTTTFGTVDEKETERLTKAWNDLGRPVDAGWVRHGGLGKKDRGDGQQRAMDDWNAMGAIAWAKKIGVAEAASADLAQRWEWLHIQASSLGGATKKGNLVPGSFVVNSAMTPWESRLRRWRDRTPNTGSFEVWFRPTPGAKGPIATEVQVRVKVSGHPSLKDGEHVVAIFHPITGVIVDRLADIVGKAESLTDAHRPHAERVEYDAAIVEVRAGRAIPKDAKKAARLASDHYLRALDELSAGRAVDPSKGARAAADDYVEAITTLKGWDPRASTVDRVVKPSPAAVAAKTSYVTWWTSRPVPSNLAEQAAKDTFDEATLRLAKSKHSRKEQDGDNDDSGGSEDKRPQEKKTRPAPKTEQSQTGVDVEMQ